jgi:ATP-dependent exoDNAse (exonuclease V) alpha subunit
MDHQQTAAVEALVKMRDAIVVGGAGAGKSHVVRTAIKRIDDSIGTQWSLILCATHTACAGYPPGRAVTISSFVRAGGKTIPANADPRSVKTANRAFKLALDKQCTAARVLIIDEFGLLGDKLEQLLRWKPDRTSVWLVGDLGQIVREPAPWTSAAFVSLANTATVIHLGTNHRIADDEPELKAIIAHARAGTLSRSSLRPFWDAVICCRRPKIDGLVLTAAVATSMKRVVAAAKARDEPLVTAQSVVHGKTRRTTSGPKFALGSRIMITRRVTDTAKAVHHQGEFGTVTKISGELDADRIEVELDHAFSIRGQKSTNSGPAGLVTTTQLPIIDAAALTVHRVQGATLGDGQVAFDGARAMEPGCVYVWLTRVVSIRQLAAFNLTAEDVDRLAPSKLQIKWADLLETRAR